MTLAEANERMHEITKQNSKDLDEFKLLLARGVEINRYGGDYVADTFGYWLSEHSDFLGQLIKD